MRAQIEAGVQAIQIFDSWAGQLVARRLPRVRAAAHAPIFDALRGTGVPTIHFGVQHRARSCRTWRRPAATSIGVDWRAPLDEAWARIGHDRAIQGNLDPVRLLGPVDGLFAAADDVLRRAAGRPGHIFNLGHGVLPQTPLEHVQALARHVHSHGLRVHA